MRQAVLVIVFGVALAGTSCQECESLLDCGLQEICTREGTCIEEPPAPPPPEPVPCQIIEDSPLFDPTQGFLVGDTEWTCPQRVLSVGGDGPKITGVEGLRVTVTGSLFELTFTHEGEIPPNSILIYGIEPNVYFARALEGPLENPLRAQLFVRPFADGGDYDFFMGIDPGVGTQDLVQPTALFRTELRVIEVQSGDIQVNVSWDTVADVDLHVFSPTGEHVFFGSTSVASGGTLDLDSNVGCGSSTDERNENIVWPTGTAPEGEFQIHVNLFGSDCGSAVTNYRVVVVRDLQLAEIVEGQLLTEEIGQNGGNGELVTTVTWPPP